MAINYMTIGVLGGMSTDMFKYWVINNNIEYEDLDELQRKMLITNAQHEAGCEAIALKSKVKKKDDDAVSDYDRAMGVI